MTHKIIKWGKMKRICEFVFIMNSVNLADISEVHIFVAAILFVEMKPSTGEFGNRAIRESEPCLQFL